MSRLKTIVPVFILTVAHGGVDFYGALLQALAPIVALHLGMPIGRIVALVGVAQLVMNGIQPLIGWIMGKRNLAWLLWVAMLLSILPAFMGLTGNYWLLAALVVVGAVGTGAYHPEGLLTAHDASGERAHLGVPLFMAGGYFFSAASAPIAILWATWFDLPALAWLAIPGLAITALLYFINRRRRRRHPSLALRPRSQRKTRIEAGRLSVWPLLTLATFCNIATALFLAILTSHYELTFGPESRQWAGWVMLAIGGIGSVASFFWGWLCRRKHYFLVVLLTQLAAGPLFIAVARAASPETGLWLALPLSVISPGAIYPVGVTLVRNAAGLTQSLRAGLIVGGTWGLAALAVMAAGVLLDGGVPSWRLVSLSGYSCLAAAAVAGVQLIRTRGRGY